VEFFSIISYEDIWHHGHKTFKYVFCTRTPKSSSQNVVFTGYDTLIGCFLSMSTKFILLSFITVRPVIYILK